MALQGRNYDARSIGGVMAQRRDGQRKGQWQIWGWYSTLQLCCPPKPILPQAHIDAQSKTRLKTFLPQTYSFQRVESQLA